MMRLFLRSRIERATVTGVHAGGDGSIHIDEHLMNAAELMQFEKVTIYNNATGQHADAWVIAAPGGSGEITVSSRIGSRGDKIGIACFGALHAGQILDHKPRVVAVDDHNRATTLTEITTAPR